jgi:hypothetical protein
MDSVDLPVNGRAVELDICLPCQRLWLDRQEAMDHATESASLVVAPPLERRSALRSLLGPRRTRAASVDNDEEEIPEPRGTPVLTIIIFAFIVCGVAFLIGGGFVPRSRDALLLVLFAIAILARLKRE